MPDSSNINKDQIPFITNWTHSESFGDLTNSPKVDDPLSMAEQWQSRMISPRDGGVEAQVGEYDVREAGLLSILAQHSRAVCKIAVPAGDYNNYRGKPAHLPWSGTGFLVGPNLLLTNHHVLNDRAVAKAATANFSYQFTNRDILDGPPDSPPPAVQFSLNPERLFVTSPMNGFDFTFVWIDSVAAEQFGSIQMTRGSFTAKEGEPVYIIHHPEGVPKKVSLDDTEVLSINTAGVLYAADTLGGSSGAPVFGDRGRLVALHHAWWSKNAAQRKYASLTGKLNDGRNTNVVNEGIKLSAIAIELERRASGNGEDADSCASILSHIKGSDTLTGLFGSLGRNHPFNAEESSGPSAYEHVVTVYQSSEQDIDIGAWNIEWLNRDYKEPGKLERVAQVITDLNLDIWALVEVSRDAVEALLKVLKEDYNQEYEAGYSEPNSKSGKQATAVIWRPKVVTGERVEWPEDINKLFKLDSRDDLPFEAVHGKIFNRYPGLFRFSLNSDKKNFDFYLVPIHYKAKGEGSLRRKLASKVLSYAIDQMIKVHGADNDWVLLGDFNATLASNDFSPHTKAGFSALSAQDEMNGAFTYLKSPYKSLIDHIFLSANMSKYASEDDFFIVARDKVVSRFVKDTSDHLPIAMRLSLSKIQDIEKGGNLSSDSMIDDEFSQMLSSVGLKPSVQNNNPDFSGSNDDQIEAVVTTEKISEWPSLNWQVSGLTKSRFFTRNTNSFKRTMNYVNAHLKVQYGAGANILTLKDIAVLLMAEAGVSSSGIMDPNFIHSNGEYGFFPLPNNIDYWVGTGAPEYNKPMSVDTNIRYYLAYLGQLKNKPVRNVSGLVLYPGLFEQHGIVGNTERAAKLLAGIVHGYFWEGNFSDEFVPINKILNGYSADKPLDQIMADTAYVHAGKTLMVNRQKNINSGLALV